MVAATFVQTIVNQRPKRTRKPHTKVRTGCQTCKIRRKKCDEAKPFCLQCTSKGYKCDGYEDSGPKPNTGKPTSRHNSTVDVSSLRGAKSSTSSLPSFSEARDQSLRLWKPPQSDWFQTDHDSYCFDFFRHRTGPEFAAYFDSSIWRSFIVRACFLYPTVLQAATAVGAVHRRFELGISPEAFRFCGIAANQYRKAIKCLDQDLKSGHPMGAEINMIASMLLCMFETFQGHYDSAVTHHRSSLTQLFRRNMKRTHSETQRLSVNVDYNTLHKFTDRLEDLAPKFFGSPTTILSTPSANGQLDPIPKIFTSLEQARDIIVTEGQHIWDAWLQLELGNLKGFSTQQMHVSRLLEWSRAYAEYSKSDSGRSRPASRQRYLLKSYREAMYLVILTQLAFHEPDGHVIVPLCYLPQTCDHHAVCRSYSERARALNAHFARITVLADSLFNDRSSFAYEKHSICVDSGIGPPLRLGADTCRSSKVRYQATSLLPKGDLQEQVCNTLGVYNIAEKMGSIEEHALVAAAAAAIPDSPEPKWVDATCFLEERKMLLRHCREDEFGGLVWTQEWHTY